MGSLARGGFSPLVSDIDIGIILGAPILAEDASRMGWLQTRAMQGFPNIDNPISIFWGSVESLNRDDEEGRYPPFDRLDLIESGKLVAGDDILDQLIRPTHRELIGDAARFAMKHLLVPNLIEYCRAPDQLVAQGVRQVTKWSLFPVRFVYTLATGAVAGNSESVQWARDHLEGPERVLATSALMWRDEPWAPSYQTLVLGEGLAPLYRWFIQSYLEQATLPTELIDGFESWHTKLDT